jgi:oxygen-independent coproporphyrinogen III oxidase
MKRVSLYIHIPFCAKKCMYCDFPSFCGKGHLMMQYAEALSREILDSAQNKKISTIFVGGGTPTYLSLEAWKLIGEAIGKLKLEENVEFTVECNPGTITEEKLLYFKKIGVNRLSIGLQSWQDELLESIGRIHTKEEFLESYNIARRLGFKNINIDIMFGLPNQNLQDIQFTLEQVVKINPEHISCYSLIIEEGTPFYNLNEKGMLNLPEEELEREMYNTACKMLRSYGYEQYEISNFAKSGYRCQHNLVYWQLEDYIGCGSAAHSYFQGSRYRNETNIEKYIQNIKLNNCSIVEKIENSTDDNIEEFMFMCLRKTEGIEEAEFNRRFSKSIDSIYKEVISKYEKLGLLIRENGRLFLSEKGIEVSNTIMSEFIL